MTTIQERLRGPVAAAAQAYTDAWFSNPGTARPVHSIPARETDTDLVLAHGIKDAAERIDALEKALREAFDEGYGLAASCTPHLHEVMQRKQVAWESSAARAALGEDAELNRIADERSGGPFVKVDIDALEKALEAATNLANEVVYLEGSEPLGDYEEPMRAIDAQTIQDILKARADYRTARAALGEGG